MAARYIMVMVGGAVGSLTRYITGSAVMSRFGGRFPLGTFVINVSGSFLIGVLMTLLTERFQPHPNWRLLLVVGFLGGYTTFSSFEYERSPGRRCFAGARGTEKPAKFTGLVF